MRRHFCERLDKLNYKKLYAADSQKGMCGEKNYFDALKRQINKCLASSSAEIVTVKDFDKNYFFILYYKNNF